MSKEKVVTNSWQCIKSATYQWSIVYKKRKYSKIQTICKKLINKLKVHMYFIMRSVIQKCLPTLLLNCLFFIFSPTFPFHFISWLSSADYFSCSRKKNFICCLPSKLEALLIVKWNISRCSVQLRSPNHLRKLCRYSRLSA